MRGRRDTEEGQAQTARTSTSAGTPESTSEPGAWSDAAAVGFPLEVTDAAGQQHVFDQPVSRIGCEWYGCPEMLAELGLEPVAVSMREEDLGKPFYFPTGARPINVTDSTAEEWAKAEVDLIVVRVPESPENDGLEAAAPVFYFHHPSYGRSSAEGIDAYRENLRLMARITGKPELAEAAIDRYEDGLAALVELVADPDPDLVLADLTASDDGGYYPLGSENPFCALLLETGLGKCVPGVKEWEMSAEGFLAANPDWIVYEVTYQPGATWRKRDDPVWHQLAAVKEGRVYDHETYYCCGLRTLLYGLQDFIAEVYGEDTGVPDPGPRADYDPAQSPVLRAS